MGKDMTWAEAAEEIRNAMITTDGKPEADRLAAFESIIRDVVKRVIETEKDRIPTAAYRRILDRIREGDN